MFHSQKNVVVARPGATRLGFVKVDVVSRKRKPQKLRNERWVWARE